MTLWGKGIVKESSEVFGEIRKRSVYCLYSDAASIGFVLPLKLTKPAANCRKGLAAPVTPIFRRKE